MAENNENEFSRMRQEAVRRMQEMQRRAQGIFGVGSTDSGTESIAEEDTEKPSARRSDGGSPSAGGHHPQHELFKLAGIPIDEEKALIGMLIYILYKQGADIKLLLALGYLLL